jgi:MFS family permease
MSASTPPGWLPLAVLSFGTISMGLSVSVMIPMLPGLAAHFGRTEHAAFLAQIIFTAAFVGMMIGGPVAGWISSRFGPRRLHLASIALFTLSGVAGLVLDGAVVFFAWRFALGVSCAGINAASVAMLSQRFDAQQRARVLGYYNASGPIASLLMISLAGATAEHIGWRAPFAFYLIGAVVLLAAFTTGNKAQPPIATPSPWPQARPKRYWPIYLIVIPFSIPIYTTSVQVPFLLDLHNLARPSLIAVIAAASSAAIAVGALSYGVVRARLGNVGTLGAMLALIGSGHWLLGEASTLPVMVAAASLAQLGGGLVVPHFLNLLLARAHPVDQGRVAGNLYTAHFLGAVLNPFVMQPFNQAFGVGFSVSALGTLLLVNGLACGLYALRTAERTSS